MAKGKKVSQGPEFTEEDFSKKDFEFYPPGEIDWAVVKKADKMPTVTYEGAHLNLAFEDERRGVGKDHATWVFCEEPGKEEGLAESALELFIDARLDPGASVGLHFHKRTEEVYYILEGSMEITVYNEHGEQQKSILEPGDAHMLKVGQGHYAVAGPKGVRFITVGVRR